MLASRQPIIASVRRDAWVEVDLGAIEHNIALIASWLKPGTKIMAVVKSDAYGHGAVGTAEVLAASGANWFGVASVDEGCQLRGASVKEPILLLSPCPSWALATAIESDLQLTVTSASQIKDIEEAALQTQKVASVHLKVDTGMHRLGVAPSRVPETLANLLDRPMIRLAGVFSHLAKADEAAMTARQNDCFQEILAKVRELGAVVDLAHLSSGDATRLFPETHHDMVRPGLILYGLEPRQVSPVVKPAMSVRGRINHMQDIEAGESVGYSQTWTAQRRSRIASIPIGYGDGIDRGLSNRISGLLHGMKVQQIGLISMDQMLFDITDVEEAQEGDVVTLIGADTGCHPGNIDRRWTAETTLYLSTWANLLDTVTYELCCRLRARMPRIYTRHITPSDLRQWDSEPGEGKL